MKRKIPVKVYGDVYKVDEGLSLCDMQRAQPEFFRTPHGKRETLESYRGCLIVRSTRDYSYGRSDRVTVVYLWGRIDQEKPGLSSFCLGHPPDVKSAKRMIDDVLKSGIARV